MESILQSLSLSLIVCMTLVYMVAGALYRLYLCPLARYPGPTLAVLTFWYEFYYDVICNGKYTWKIQELHEKYGPVVRINPGELHVIDPAFYDTVYVGSTRRTEKWEYSARMFGTSLAAVGTIGHELHRLRRSALNAFFSKRSMSRLEPTIQTVVDHACEMLGEAGQGGHIVNLRNFFAAFSADVIGEVAFGSGYGLLDRPDFEPGWQKLMMDLSRATHLMKQFPWAYAILISIPQSLVSLVHPLARRLFDIRGDIHLKIEQAKETLDYDDHRSLNPGKEEDDAEHPTVLHSILSSSALPAPELQSQRLEDEAFTLLGAGTITTAHTLTIIVYHVLANVEIKRQLEAELSDLCSAPLDERTPHLKALEHSAYLSAVVSEGLRLSFGVSHRLPRIAPDTALHYQGTVNGQKYDYTIPPGVPVSMTQMFTHLDPRIYTSPHTFDPQRWLASACDTSSDKEELHRRRHHLVPFSKGTRMCAGMHLAYAELYLMLGTLFAPGGVATTMQLFETGEEDVQCVHDFFNPSPRLDSEGVRAVLDRQGR